MLCYPIAIVHRLCWWYVICEPNMWRVVCLWCHLYAWVPCCRSSVYGFRSCYILSASARDLLTLSEFADAKTRWKFLSDWFWIAACIKPVARCNYAVAFYRRCTRRAARQEGLSRYILTMFTQGNAVIAALWMYWMPIHPSILSK